MTSSGDLVFQSALFEPALDDFSNNSEIISPFNAFAGAGISEVNNVEYYSFFVIDKVVQPLRSILQSYRS